jgi:hypothetical protein
MNLNNGVMEQNDFSDWTIEELRSLVEVIGEKRARRLIQVKFYPELEVQSESLFNDVGIRLWNPGHINMDVRSSSFYFPQPRLLDENDFRNRLAILRSSLGIDTEITAEKFQRETAILVKTIENDPAVCNLLNNAYLPIIMPMLSHESIGEELSFYVDGAGESHVRRADDKEFKRIFGVNLFANTEIVQGSRYQELIEKMKKKSVVAIYFPNALSGSLSSQLEQLSGLPEGFMLPGLDVAIAMAMYPEILAFHTGPALCLTALKSKHTEYIFHFKNKGKKLYFVYGSERDDEANGYSKGLLYVR